MLYLWLVVTVTFLLTGSDSSSVAGGIYEAAPAPVGKPDLSDLDLYLDDVVVSEPELVPLPLSASRLRLLQDTTMIESALDLDSLEESTSSVGAGSQAGLIKKKEVL